ncbi:MAG TPA: leucyl aminopeptidase [Pyrinomonadaceae bacterium]|nr:leucyl aminopeptidase [Pyrinomonadaceae bacterium]
MTDENFFAMELSAKLPPEASDVAVCVFEDEPGAADGELREMVEGLRRDGEFKGEAGTSLLVHAAGAGGARRLLVAGLGERKDFDARAMSRAAAAVVRRAGAGRIKRLNFVLPRAEDARRLIRAAAEGAVLGLYENSFYRKREDDARLETLNLVSAEFDTEETDEMLREMDRGRVVAESVNWARALADEPGGSLPPEEFARRAALMAAEFGLRVETLGADEIRARGMGGLWGVGKGSDNPPALIVVRYEPDGASADDELWAFVGKGITFDTGGISIKHGLDMYEMKTDMAGGAAVLGALRAVAQLKPPRRVVGVVPSAENMPSGRAIKPGDVIKTLAGYTIEVVDTDAEGRLVLADGIAYAKQLGAKRIVDLATLTGSIVVALGDHRTGLFGNDDDWAKSVERAAARAGEPAWRMPVSDDYKKRIESPIADFKNYGGRPDATAAALLLSKFAGNTPWVHLDIAGTSWLDSAAPHAPKGSTGTGVRTLVELVCGEAPSA